MNKPVPEMAIKTRTITGCNRIMQEFVEIPAIPGAELCLQAACIFSSNMFGLSLPKMP